MTAPDSTLIFVAAAISFVIGVAANPVIEHLRAKASDFIVTHRPAVWKYRTICEECGNAPEKRADVHFRQRVPRVRRAAMKELPNG